MARKSLLKVQLALKNIATNKTERLVIQARSKNDFSLLPPDLEAFQTRHAYREALIKYEESRDLVDFKALVERLKKVGLKIRSSEATQVVIAEGLPSLLIEALEDKGIENADFDRPIELIRPVSLDSE